MNTDCIHLAFDDLYPLFLSFNLMLLAGLILNVLIKIVVFHEGQVLGLS